MPDSVLEGFEKETGIHINQYLYSSNEDMLAKGEDRNEGIYDILQPTDYMVKSLIAQELLEPLDLSGAHQQGAISAKQYMDQEFDPGNRVFDSFMGSCTAIAYNEDEVDKPETLTICSMKFRNNIVTLNDFH